MLDQIRQDIQNRIDELLSEIDSLHRALAELASVDGEESADGMAAGAKSAGKAAAGRSRAASEKAISSARSSSRKAAGQAADAARSAQGATKSAVLGALRGGAAMTASEIAAATGLGRATISTTLTRLASAGEVSKAARGYVIKTDTEDGAWAGDSGGVETAGADTDGAGA